jgi:hypothetical protein
MTATLLRSLIAFGLAWAAVLGPAAPPSHAHPSAQSVGAAAVTDTAGCYEFVANLDGAQEVPAVTTSAKGFGMVTLSPDESFITVALRVTGLSSNQTLGHIHGPAPRGGNALVIFDLGSQGNLAPVYNVITFSITSTQLGYLRAGQMYFNIHTINNGGGEVRGQIECARGYEAFLTGDQEVPAVTTNATGYGTVHVSADETSMGVNLRFGGLSSNQTLGHIHIGPPGGAGPVAFDLGSQGSVSGTVTALMFTVAPTQVVELKAGNWYFNIHTVNNGAGEIRGQIGAPPACELRANLSPAEEVTAPITTTATGYGRVHLNADNTRIFVNLNVNGLSSNQTLGHIHTGPIGTNGPVTFDLGSQGGTRASYVAASFPITPTQVGALRAGGTYFNIHTVTNGGGEVRGQIVSTCRNFLPYVERAATP